MIQVFELQPHKGVNEIKFGFTREQVRKLLGPPEYSKEPSVFEFQDIKIPEPGTDGYFESELQITYDEDFLVDYIEFSGRHSRHVKVCLGEIEIFRTPARELLHRIKDLTGEDYDPEEPEMPYTYIFRTIDLSLWRQVIPEVDENSVEVPESDEGKYFWTVGVGKPGYYEND